MSRQSEKTEQPTPKRLRDARQKGQVARSQELVTSISLFAIIGTLWFGWSAFYSRLVLLFDGVAAHAADFSDHRLMAALYEVAWLAIVMVFPVLAATVLAGLLANFLQVGALFTAEAVKPKGERINPATGLRRIFSRRQLTELLKSVLKICFLSLLLFLVIREAINPFMSSLFCGLLCQTGIALSALAHVLVWSALAFGAVAVADLVYQRRAHIRSLMMTREEVKREFKEMEGDPHIKSKRRQLAQELAMEDRGQAARKTTAIVINPTHLAVAIYYSPEKVPVPVVTAKGRNKEAYHMIGQAEEAGVPIFRSVELARSLYADVDLYQPVPEELFDAVAEILAWVADHRDALYAGRLEHGVIDVEDLRSRRQAG